MKIKVETPVQLYRLAPNSLLVWEGEDTDDDYFTPAYQKAPSGRFLTIGASMSLIPEAVLSGSGELFVVHEGVDKRTVSRRIFDEIAVLRDFLKSELPKQYPGGIEDVDVRRSVRTGDFHILHIAYGGDYHLSNAEAAILHILRNIGFPDSVEDHISVKEKAAAK